jgi:hypothetical protein
MRKRSFLVLAAIALAAYAGAQSPNEGDPILRFLPDGRPWSWAPFEYITGSDGSHVDKPRSPDLAIRFEKLPESDRMHPGQTVLHLIGSLNALCDTVVLEPPFQAPAKGAKASGPADLDHPESGFIYDAGFARTVSLSVIQCGQPVSVTLAFENEKGGRYSVNFEMRSSSRYLTTYTYYDQQYWNIPAQDRLGIRLGWMRLTGITIRSLGLQDEKNQNISDQGMWTEEQHRSFDESLSSHPVEETKVDLVILEARVAHEFSRQRDD